jgi:hypothetical protein
MALSIAVFVISWNTILGVVLISNFNWFAKCRQIASPSRSSSVAIHVFSADSESLFNSESTLLLSGETTYLGSKLCSTSIHNSLTGRSTVCQNEAFTS